MRRLLALTLAVALVAPASALATGGHDEDNAAQTAEALAIQALSLVLQHEPPHDEAIEKLHEALETDAKGDVDLEALRAASDALSDGDNATARRLLESAFPGESGHVVGVTYRPAIGSAQAIAGILGAAALALAALGLARRRTAEREHATG